MRVHLVTFGGLRVIDDGTRFERLLAQRSRAALLIYLTIERRVSREALTAMFWPESDSANARHALRQSLYHIRKAIGADEWVESRSHELVVRGDIVSDAGAFSEAVDRGDMERALRLYHGPFLQGVHLVDSQPWESWVDGRRTRYARLFRKACRNLLDVKLAARDFHGAIEVAERWTVPDPTDDEAQHRLIAALAAAGERAEAIHQYETYARLLASDGLEPLDETRDLVERLRADRQRTAPPRPRPLARRVGSRPNVSPRPFHPRPSWDRTSRVEDRSTPPYP